MSPKFKKEEGFVFKIYSNEEERMHIHVVKAEYEAKFWLEPTIELAENFGFSSKDIKKITNLVEKYGNQFKEQFAAPIIHTFLLRPVLERHPRRDVLVLYGSLLKK